MVRGDSWRGPNFGTAKHPERRYQKRRCQVGRNSTWLYFNDNKLDTQAPFFSGEIFKRLKDFNGCLLTLLLSTFFNRNVCHKYRHHNHISQSGIFKVKGLSTFLNCHLIQFYSFTSALGFTLTLILYGTYLVLKMCQPNLHTELLPLASASRRASLH